MTINYVSGVITTFYAVGADDQLFITSTGAMTFANSIAISMNGLNSTVVNAGWVSSPNIAINTISTSFINNTVSGVITSATSGINGNASSSLSLVNDGLVSGTVSGVNSSGSILSIANVGTIAGSEGVTFTGQMLSLSNSGRVDGTSFSGIDVSAGSSVNITNSGTIFGRLEGISSLSSGTERVANSGTISGVTYAIRLGDNNSVVTNTGLIEGTTFLGAGTNYFFGGRGIQGNVIGGAELDFLYGGVGRDIFDGGGGSNSLYGGAGDDEFSAGSGNDYFVMGADTDVVFGGGGRDSIFAVRMMTFCSAMTAVTKSTPVQVTMVLTVEKVRTPCVAVLGTTAFLVRVRPIRFLVARVMIPSAVVRKTIPFLAVRMMTA